MRDCLRRGADSKGGSTPAAWAPHRGARFARDAAKSIQPADICRGRSGLPEPAVLRGRETKEIARRLDIILLGATGSPLVWRTCPTAVPAGSGPQGRARQGQPTWVA